MTEQQKKTRIVSIDYGLARIGMAVSDESHMLASPLPDCRGGKKMDRTVKGVVDTIEALATERNCEISTVVVGLPLMMSGKQGLMADEVHTFVKALEAASSWPVVTWDERLTSVQADRTMREGGLNRKKRSKKVDSVSALIILQNYLDSLCFQH